jgi:hypothetical protein
MNYKENLPVCILVLFCQVGASSADYKRTSCTDLETSICLAFLTSQPNFFRCYASKSLVSLFRPPSTKVPVPYVLRS